MEQRNSLVVILVAVLLGSAALAPRSSSPTYMAPPTVSSQSRNGSATSPTTPLRANDAQGIVEEFFSGSFKDDHYKLPPDWKIDSLIAIVPDPVESGLPSVFDDYVDSIEQAVSAERYDLDHFYNPWPSPGELARKRKSDQSDDTDDSSDESEAEKQLVPVYETQPGLILFRAPDQRRLLVVFLVGETPTTGVHKAAFEDALRQASELPPSICSNGANCLRVMGPSFSGSATSMRLAIAEWSDHRPKGSSPNVEIISGAATAVAPNTFKGPQVTYKTTIIPTDAEIEALLKWLGKSNGKGVAILNEENTSFGNLNGGLTQPKILVGPQLIPDMLRLRYPLHIAEIQRAAERAAQTANSGASTTPSLSNPNLPLDSKESRNPQDLLPLYSSAETNRQELVLDANLREINEYRISYVIITATDPADTLFLVHWIRQNCPNVIPIVLDADLLYLHSAANPDTRGMIVASTYPLYLENQLWTSDRYPIQFSLVTSEGIYNATLELLDPSAPLLDYATPFSPNFKGPPLWIAFVGVDQLWPVSIRDPKVPAGFMVEHPFVQTAATATDYEFNLYSKPFLITCFLIVLGCFPVCSFILGSDTRKPTAWLRSKTPAFIRQVLGPAVLPEYSAARRRVTRLFSIVLLCLLGTMAYYFFLPFRMGMAGELNATWKFWATLFVTSAVVAVWLVLFAPRSWLADIDPLRTGQPPWRKPPGIILSLLVLFPFVAVVVCMIVWLLPPADPAARLFVFLRTADLGSKVSQLVPMLLTYAAAIALILGALFRLALLESRQVLTPFLNFGEDSFSGFADLEKRVRNLVGTGAWSWRTRCAIALPIGLAYLLALPFRQLFHSHIDTAAFKCLFSVLSLAVYVGIGLAIVKMVSVWLSVRKLLHRIYTHPSRGGYDAYRQQLHFLKEPAIDLLSKVPAMSQLEVAVDQVRQLVITTDDPSTSVVPEVNARLSESRLRLRILLSWVERGIDETEQAQANGNWRDEVEKKREIEVRIGSLSRTIAHIFEPLWRTTGANAAREKGEKDPHSIDTIGEIYVASRVVDFLRQVMPQLESLALSTTLAMLLMLFAVSSYPFPARDDLLWFSWFVVLATVGSMMWMFFSLNRDRVASMIAGTTPGQTDWNSTLVLQLTTHALIPIMVLLGAAFPARLGALATWIGSLFGGHS